jgi:hypothetical protein
MVSKTAYFGLLAAFIVLFILAIAAIVAAAIFTRRIIRRRQNTKNELRSLAADLYNARQLVRGSLTGGQNPERDVEHGVVKIEQGFEMTKVVSGPVPEKKVEAEPTRKKETEHKVQHARVEEGEAEEEEQLQEVGFAYISTEPRMSAEVDEGQWTEVDLDEKVEPPSREQTRSPRVWFSIEKPRDVE